MSLQIILVLRDGFIPLVVQCLSLLLVRLTQLLENHVSTSERLLLKGLSLIICIRNKVEDKVNTEE